MTATRDSVKDLKLRCSVCGKAKPLHDPATGEEQFYFGRFDYATAPAGTSGVCAECCKLAFKPKSGRGP